MERPGESEIAAALGRLGIERLVLSIQQASFPASPDDLGHGAPLSDRGRALLHRVAELGFTGVLLGPAGIISPNNASPYDGTAFSKNPLALSLAPLTGSSWGGLLDPDRVERFERRERAADPSRVDYRRAFAGAAELLGEFAEAARTQPERVPDLERRIGELRTASPWLDAEARFEGIAAAVGHDDWRRWPSDPAPDPAAAERFVLIQLAALEQHAELHRFTRSLGLALYGDLQIGISHRDRWLHRSILLDGWALGAPPSRTNPDGQPWEYPVLDPLQLGSGGAARRFMEARFAALLADYDGVRIDHPQGWICPWVYRAGAADPIAAVQAGARLYESPGQSEHPELTAFARVRPEQIDRSLPRHHDHWVRWLDPEQIDTYALPFTVLLELAELHGKEAGDLLIEVLSTCPRPLEAALERQGLGRFRVTSKARVEDPNDVYLGTNAKPADWIMIGNHDTPPIRALAKEWVANGQAAGRASYLARRLATTPAEAERVERECASDPRALAQAMLAELFLGPATNVLLFWIDWLGGSEPYNRPGLVHSDNWTQRVPPDFDRALTSPDAPSIPRALAAALHARGLDRDPDGAELTARLTT